MLLNGNALREFLKLFNKIVGAITGEARICV